MLFKRNNKTENKNIENNKIEENVNKSEAKDNKQQELFTDEELIANKKKEDNYFFEYEADILIGKDEKKPSKAKQPEKKILENITKEENKKIEVVEEEIVPYEEKSEKIEETLDNKTNEQKSMEASLVEFEELKDRYNMLEEKNSNLARILKDLSVELKDAREESERQFEVIGKLASEKQELERQNKDLAAKANKLEYDVEIKEGELSAFKEIGDEADDIQSQLFNYKETAKKINSEFKDKKAKLKESLIKVQELETRIRELESELNTIKDEKDSLATVVLQQQKKLNNQDNLETYVTTLNEKNVDYKDLDRKLKNEVDELSDQVRNKDRLIIRQIGEIAKLNEVIKELNNDILVHQDKIDELVFNSNKNLLEINASKNFIKPQGNGTLLGKVMENELDLKLKNVINVSKEKMVEDEEISGLLEKIDTVINTTAFNNNDKQFKFEVFEGIQNAILEFINGVVQKEATAYDYIVKMNDFELEKSKIVSNYEKEISDLKKKLNEIEKENNKLKIEIFEKTSKTIDNRTIGEFKEDNERLNKQIGFLKEENEILSKNNKDEAIAHLANVLEKERESNRETEKLLKSEIATLREKLSKATSDLEKLNGEYVLTKFESELQRIDDFITKIENGTIELKSNILDQYYEEAHTKFFKQVLIFNDEINKRDELLKQLLDDKSEEQGRMVELDMNGDLEDDPDAKERIKNNNKLMEAIETILGSKIIRLELDSKKELDKKVLESFKEVIKNMYQDMIKNINESAKAYTDELTETSAVKAMELFNNDANKMAKYYSEAVNEAYLEHQTSTNEFFKIISNARIATLCNEFATLIKFKEEKSREKFNGIYHENGEYSNVINDNFSGTLDEIKDIKESLTLKLANLNQTFSKELTKLEKDIDNAKFQISDLEARIDKASETEAASLRIDLDAKNKVLNYLEHEKKNEIIDSLNKQIQDVKLQLETIDNTERKSKEDYLERSNNESTFNKNMNNLSLDINDAYGIKEINQYLNNLNNIELGYIDALSTQNDEFEVKVNAIHEQMDNINKKATYYRDLVLLKTDLTNTLNVMKTDYKQIREYETILNEYNSLTRQVKFYENEIAKAKERIACDIDAEQSKDSVLMFQAKLLNLNSLVEAKNEELEEAKNYYIVSQYVNVVERLNRIDEIIKEKGKEI